MKIVVIDYGSGNLQSVVNAVERLDLGAEIIVSNDKNDLKSASHIILPGVGSFNDCMAGLRSFEGLVDELRYQASVTRKPFLGICVGMQVLASIGFENGEHKGLDFIQGKVEKIPQNGGRKVPHMGWNELEIRLNHEILDGVNEGDHIYFANSFHFTCFNSANIVAQVDYGFKMNAILAKANIIGLQFHPEKSGEVGLRILRNFFK